MKCDLPPESAFWTAFTAVIDRRFMLFLVLGIILVLFPLVVDDAA